MNEIKVLIRGICLGILLVLFLCFPSGITATTLIFTLICVVYDFKNRNK